MFMFLRVYTVVMIENIDKRKQSFYIMRSINHHVVDVVYDYLHKLLALGDIIWKRLKMIRLYLSNCVFFFCI